MKSFSKSIVKYRHSFTSNSVISIWTFLSCASASWPIITLWRTTACRDLDGRSGSLTSNPMTRVGSRVAGNHKTNAALAPFTRKIECQNLLQTAFHYRRVEVRRDTSVISYPLRAVGMDIVLLPDCRMSMVCRAGQNRILHWFHSWLIHRNNISTKMSNLVLYV